MKKLTIPVASLLVATGFLAGCSSDDAQSEPVTVVETITTTTAPASEEAARPSPTLDDTPAEETQAQSEGGFDRSPDNKVIEVADLKSLWVPELCGNQAGNLMDGVLPANLKGPHGGQAMLVMGDDNAPKGAYTDINGDGKDEAVVTYYCDQGGVSWPQTLLIYDNDLNYLDKVEAEDMSLNGYKIYGAHIRDLSWDANKVYVTWYGWQESDPSCCASRELSGELTMPGGVPSLTLTDDQPAT